MATVTRTSGGAPGRQIRLPVFRILVATLSVVVAGVVLVTMGRLAVWTWQEYGTNVWQFYRDGVFGNALVRRSLINTAIAVPVSCALATFMAGVLAWLNERTDASLGLVGRVLPIIPFLMPAIALPLGWIFLAAPQAGVLNVLLRSALGSVGINVENGPINIYSWYGLIFVYAVFLCGFAYLVLGSAMRNLDSGLEEAARMAGAGALRIMFRVVFPALKPAFVSAFFMCLIVGLIMISVPITIGSGANISILSVLLVERVTTQTPPLYADAFLIGLLLLIPLILLWLLQRWTARKGKVAVIGGRASSGAAVRLGRGRKFTGRLVFVVYALLSVVLPLAGLIYVAGLGLWSSTWPDHWDLVGNVQAAITNPVTGRAIYWSVVLGLTTAAALILVSHVISYGQRLFPVLGTAVDGLSKSPAVVPHILLAIALLITVGGPPWRLQGTAWILFIGYLITFIPFASVITMAAQQAIGRDLLEAAQMSGSSDLRTFRSVVSPLTRPALVAGFVLMYVMVSGETNISLILASPQRPVVGYVMLDLFNYGSFPQVSSFALVVTVLNLGLIAIMMVTTSSRLRRW